MSFDRRRGPVEVELNILLSLVVIKPALHQLADVLHPLPHVPALDLVQEGGETMQEINVLVKIVKVLINPVFEHVEHSELNGLNIFLPEPFLILDKPQSTGFVGLIKLRDVESVDEKIKQLLRGRKRPVSCEKCLHEDRCGV